MSIQSVDHVLSLLRKIKNTAGLSVNNTPYQFIQNWSGVEGSVSDQIALRLCLAISEQLADAERFIRSRNLPQEAEEGMMDTIQRLKNAFSIPHMNSAMQNMLPSLPTYLSGFAMLAGILKSGFSAQVVPADITEMIAEIDKLVESFKSSSIESDIRDKIVASLIVLSGMLRNIDAVGVEAAMETYANLIIKISRPDYKSAVDGGDDSGGWIDKMKKWGARIAALGNFADNGVKLIEGGGKVMDLLS